MSLTATDLQQMSYRELVELAKVNGVYQKKSAKKVALIRRLSSVCASPPEVSGIENVDPNKSKLTPLKEVDETCVSGSDDEGDNRRKTFTKEETPRRGSDGKEMLSGLNSAAQVKKNKRKDSPLTDMKPPVALTRQNTFTKGESPEGGDLGVALTSRKSKRLSEVQNTQAEAPETEDPPPLARQSTFTRSDEPLPSQPAVHAAEDKPPVNSPEDLIPPNSGSKGITKTPNVKRQNTFTRSPIDSSPKEGSIAVEPSVATPLKNIRNTPRSGRKAPSAKSAKKPALTRAGTFTKTPEKKECDMPIANYESPAKKTPPIETLSVFQRLSTKIPLSDRRSLVSSEKRASLRTKFLTPQAEKKAHLVAMREGRKNNLSPKGLSKTLRAATMTTPVVPVMKQPASMKKSSAKKMPNFAAIHKKNFEKMESLYENKRRLKERSDFLMSPVRISHISRIPKLAKVACEPGNKNSKASSLLQMKMATKERLKKAVAQKCSTGLAAQKQSNDSKILKGVRTNKRFELLRQAQKMKPTGQVNR